MKNLLLFILLIFSLNAVSQNTKPTSGLVAIPSYSFYDYPSDTTKWLYWGNNKWFKIYSSFKFDSLFNKQAANYIPKFSGNNKFLRSQIYANTTGVGIGTNNPQFPVDIQSTTNQTLNIQSNNTSSTSIVLNNTSSGGHDMQFYSTGSGNNAGLFGVWDNTTSKALMALKGSNQGAAFGSYASALTAINAPDEGIIVSGKVGIGTINPSEKLHVVGKILADSLIKGYDIQTNNRYFIGTSSGSAGQTIISAGSGSATWANPIILTTNDTTGVATYTGSTRTLNIPNYKTTAYVPYTGAVADVNVGSYTMYAIDFCRTSDLILKTNIKAIKKKDFISIDFVKYRLLSNPSKESYGVIAQDLEDENPDLVHTDANGIKSVSYMDLLILKVAELEYELNKLKQEYKKHKSKSK